MKQRGAWIISILFILNLFRENSADSSKLIEQTNISKTCYEPHVITGNLMVTENIKLKGLVAKRPKHQEVNKNYGFRLHWTTSNVLECVKITSVDLKLDRTQLQRWLLFLQHNRPRSKHLNVVEQPDHSLTNSFIYWTLLGNLSFLLHMKIEETLKIPGINFCMKIFQTKLKNTKIRILYPKNMMSIPIILLWKCPRHETLSQNIPGKNY